MYRAISVKIHRVTSQGYHKVGSNSVGSCFNSPFPLDGGRLGWG